MARNVKAPWQIVFSTATKMKDTQRKRLPAYTSEEHTPTHIHAKSIKNAKTQHQHNQATNTEYFNSMSCSRKKRMTGKHFMKLFISI
jgi:hypothetical protein